MIKPKSEMDTETRSKMRGGNGDVKMTHIFKKDELTGRCRLFAKVELEPGCSIGLHDHVDEEEVYYITAGEGRVTDNGVTRDVSVGDAVLTGGGDSHSIENIGTDTLEFVAVILLYE